MYPVELDTKSVASALGISVRQLGHWDALGIVSPSARPAVGSGSRRLYAPEDLLPLLATRELRRCHLPLDRVRDAVARLRSGLRADANANDFVVWTEDGVIHVALSESAAMSACRNVSSAIVLNLARLRRELAALGPMATRPSTHLFRLGERCLQALLIAEGDGYVARCNAYPECNGRGADIEAAIAALKRAIEGRTPGKVDKDKPPRVTRRRDAPRKPRTRGGAASWGGDW